MQGTRNQKRDTGNNKMGNTTKRKKEVTTGPGEKKKGIQNT